MASLYILIKVTNNCDLRCKYCFHQENGYDAGIIPIEYVKKILSLATEKHDSIHVIWHGGEPLLAPIEFYESIFSYAELLPSKITYSMQSNGISLSKEYASFLSSNKIAYGISFDGISNDIFRGKTQRVLTAIKIARENGLNPSIISVVTNETVNRLIDNYHYFNELGLSYRFNTIEPHIDQEGHTMRNIDGDAYISKYIDLFNCWASDENCRVGISNFRELIDLNIRNQSTVCTFGSCLGRWLCMDKSGDIYPCDRLCNPMYNICNIEKIESIEDVFFNEKFYVILKSAVERIEQCKLNCDIFKQCYGGCNSTIINEKKTNACGQMCNIHKQIIHTLSPIINYLYTSFLKDKTKIKNPVLKRYFSNL